LKRLAGCIDRGLEVSRDAVEHVGLYAQDLQAVDDTLRPSATATGEEREGFCRKVAFLRTNVKIVCRKINDLRASTFLFSVICDRTSLSQVQENRPLFLYFLSRDIGT